jgi:hypothetical protein
MHAEQQCIDGRVIKRRAQKRTQKKKMRKRNRWIFHTSHAHSHPTLYPISSAFSFQSFASVSASAIVSFNMSSYPHSPTQRRTVHLFSDKPKPYPLAHTTGSSGKSHFRNLLIYQTSPYFLAPRYFSARVARVMLVGRTPLE